MTTILIALFAIFAIILAIILILTGVKIVPQSEVFIIERFGKYTKTLPAGLSLIVPFLERVSHKISVLERQLPKFELSVITKDNVEVGIKATVFYRVIDAANSVYRIKEVDNALITAAISIVRSAAGRLELDELQSSRDSMNDEIAKKLQDATKIWGIEISRTEILDVDIDEMTKESQRQQLNAERHRRATIATAEGEKRSTELAADAKYYQAEKLAAATKVQAEADAFVIRVKAEAEAEQIKLISKSIENKGQPAVDFAILKKQIEAIGKISSSENSKTIIVPTETVAVLGSLKAIFENINKS